MVRPLYTLKMASVESGYPEGVVRIEAIGLPVTLVKEHQQLKKQLLKSVKGTPIGENSAGIKIALPSAGITKSKNNFKKSNFLIANKQFLVFKMH